MSEVAWAAGVIQGEGHIQVWNRWGHPQLNHNINVGQSACDLGMLYRLQATFGGKVTARPGERFGKKPMFQWWVSGEEARACARAIAPYLSGPKLWAIWAMVGEQ